jgi:hypothetical protein
MVDREVLVVGDSPLPPDIASGLLESSDMGAAIFFLEQDLFHYSLKSLDIIAPGDRSCKCLDYISFVPLYLSSC